MLEPWRELEGNVVLGAVLGFVSACAYACNVFLARRLTESIGSSRTLGLHALLAALLLPFAGSGFSAIEVRDLPYLAIGCLVPFRLPRGLAFPARAQYHRLGAASRSFGVHRAAWRPPVGLAR
ncbi:MAG: hypothetical protein R3B99_06580 [Polyangiales bacterium]